MRSLTSTSLISLLAVATTVASAGCHSGVITVRAMGDAGLGLPSDGASAGPMAETYFETRVQPMLMDRCGGCHGPDRTGPDFLRANPDVRTTLLSFPVLVDLDSPESSRLITKGVHTGPAFTAGEITIVRNWIELEAAEGTMVEPVERELSTRPLAIHEGFNALPLESLGLPGSTIHFNARRVGGGMFLDAMQIAAGPTGVRFEHPVFVVWIDGVPIPDALDRFVGMEFEVEPNTSETFDSGTVVLTDYPEGALLSIHFDAIGPNDGSLPMGTDGGMPTGGGGCMELAAFRAEVSPLLAASCTGCHGGANPSATMSMDMTNVASADDATLLLGCNQVLGRIPAAMPESSGLFVQPDPAAPGSHPFRFASPDQLDAFRMGILGWFDMEGM